MKPELHPYEEAFLPVLQKNKEIVLINTWGHLAMVKNKKYNGSILFAISDWNSIGVCLIKSEFDNNLEDSPWLFESLQEFISTVDLCTGFYRWEGSVKNYKFKGKITNISVL